MLHCDYDAGAVSPFLSVMFDFLMYWFWWSFVVVVMFILCMLDNATVTMMLVQWVPCHFLSVAAAAPTTNHHQQTT